MGLIEDMVKGNLGAGLAIGLGTVILGPVIIPLVSRAAKPAVKAAIKGGLLLYDAGRGQVSGAKEVFGDLVHEVRSELESRGKGAAESPEEQVEEKAPGHPTGTPHEVT
jgi:hypothetical protein